jgi:hypothetical protein
MEYEQVLEELALARSKIVPTDWVPGTSASLSSNTYRTTMSNGDKVYFYIGSNVTAIPPTVSGRIISAYPGN